MTLHMTHLHHHHNGNGGGSSKRNIPKGCLAVTVGLGEEQRRFVIPVVYVNHPLFTQLLKEAEEEYGFEQKAGPINIPCHVEEFCHVMGLIDKETASSHHHHHNHHHHHDNHHHHHHHHHHHPFLCFKA